MLVIDLATVGHKKVQNYKPIAGGARGLSTTILSAILIFFSDGPSSDIAVLLAIDGGLRQLTCA